MWLDHRAVSQVHRINETKHRVLQYVGGVMSVEMQAPKLLWLKEVSVADDGRSLIVVEGFLHPRVVD
jgi:ribulose kinase